MSFTSEKDERMNIPLDRIRMRWNRKFCAVGGERYKVSKESNQHENIDTSQDSNITATSNLNNLVQQSRICDS